MEQSNRKILILAVVLAVVTSILIVSYIKKIENKNENIELVTVYTAAKDIAAKAVITSGDIKTVQIEKTLVNKSAVTNIEDIINKISKERIYEDEQILASRLADSENSSLAYQIPNGKRAITINVNEASAVGYFIKPGDFVDIIVTFQKDVQEEKDRQLITPRLSKLLLQKIMVLGVGQEKDVVDKNSDKSTKAAKDVVQNNQSTKTITLAVTPHEAEKIALSEEEGIIKLSLRPVSDEETIATTGTVKSDLITEARRIIIDK